MRAAVIPMRWAGRVSALAIGSALCVWAFLVLDQPPALLGFSLLAAVWGAASVIDVQTHHLPDLLTLGSYPAFLVLMLPSAVVDGTWGALGRAAVVGVVNALVLFIVAYINPAGFGLGDVKLGLSTGAALGWLGVAEAVVGLFAAFILMAVVGAVALAGKRLGRKSDIAFGPFMVAGVLVAPWLAQLLS